MLRLALVTTLAFGLWAGSATADSPHRAVVSPELHPALPLRTVTDGAPTAPAPSLARAANLQPGVGFDGIDALGCCGGGVVVPPDPVLAAGPRHLLHAVNLSFAVYDRSGPLLAGPITFSSFFAILGSSCAGSFFPSVLYDESADRFILATLGGGGSESCVAVSQGPDPTGAWYLYGFPLGAAGFVGWGFMGVGHDALYLGVTDFGGTDYARIYAFDKAAMYQGGAAQSVGELLDVGLYHPVPLHLHGYRQGQWPSSGPHHFAFTADAMDPAGVQLARWTDAFGDSDVAISRAFDLEETHGVAVGPPLANPQSGGATIQGFDSRILDFEYRAGSGWITNNASCDPGSGGDVNCLQWAEIDLSNPDSPSVAQAGVLGTPGVFRAYADLAVNRCGDFTLGYTRFSPVSFPSVFVAGARASDPPGLLAPELQAKAGEVSYVTFADRWGEYTGMTVAPGGGTFWYAGQYSKNIGGAANWGSWIQSYRFESCPDEIFSDGFESDSTSAWAATVP